MITGSVIAYLDSKRDFLNYPVSLQPSFAAEHTLSAVAKQIYSGMETWSKLVIHLCKGTPYYDIASAFENGKTVNYTRAEGRLKDYML